MIIIDADNIWTALDIGFDRGYSCFVVLSYFPPIDILLFKYLLVVFERREHNLKLMINLGSLLFFF